MNPHSATTTTYAHHDNCLMCVVRALTEGEPAVKWRGANPGDEITGVVLKIGSEPHQFGRDGRMLFMDLWLGGPGRARIWAGPATLENAITTSEPIVGDRVTVRYVRDGVVRSRGPFHGKPFRIYEVDVKRGHH